MTETEANDQDVTIADGWIEREPERFEERLWVTEETFSDGGIIATQHIALYDEDGYISVEWGDRGDVSFFEREDRPSAFSLIEDIMTGGYDD